MLTARNVATLPKGDYTDTVAEGLTLRIRPGARRWGVRYRTKLGTRRGPQRRLHLGDVGGPLALDLGALGLQSLAVPHALTLEAARDVARALLGLAARGVDPVERLEAADTARQDKEAEEARRKAHGTGSLGALLDRFIGEREAELRPATIRSWRGLAHGALEPLRARDPKTITARELRAFHRSIGDSGRRVTANRALELLAVLYAWGMRTEDERGEPLVSASPCASVEAFEEQLRTRVLDSTELRKVWAALDGEMFADAFMLLLWTGARKTEVLGAEWSEVDLDARLWRIPENRSKTGHPRHIPLSSPALAILRARRDASPSPRWVFPSPVASVGPLNSLQAPLARVQRRSGVAGWALHDIRRTVRTGLAALGVAVPVAEFVLGHLAPAIVRNYNRHEPLAEAAAALESWAHRLEAFVTGDEASAEVVPFGRRG